MSRFVVRLLPQARKDADHIYAWLTAHSVAGGKNWLSAFVHALRTLEHEPLAHGFAAETALRKLDIRQKLFKSRRGRVYRVLFLVVDNEVRIVRLRGPGQPPLRARELPRNLGR